MKKRLRSLLFYAAAILAAAGSVSGCGKPQAQPVSKSGFYFNTVIQVTVYGDVDERLLDDCFQLAGDYEARFSGTIEDSDISRINAAGGKPVTVGDETIDLLQKGIYYGELSGGRFDITVGVLSDLWDISTKALLNETDASMIPTREEIEAALSTVDYRGIHIDGNEVTLSDPAARIDLGGIAKGYIADRMKEFLNENGVTSGFLNLGGNVLVLGPKETAENAPGDGSYTIGIQRPFSQDNSSIASVEITDETVVSSGVYERFFEADGIRYHHILDTATGYPYDNGLLGVTVVTKHSVDGDGLSTTCFSLGLEEGMALIERTDGAEAIFITDDYQLHTSSGIGTEIPFTPL